MKDFALVVLTAFTIAIVFALVGCEHDKVMTKCIKVLTKKK